MKPILIYDGDCGFCTVSANAMRRLIRPRAHIQPWQSTDIARFGLTDKECTTAVQFVLSDGSVRAGSRAIMAMLRSAPVPWPVLGHVGDLPGVAQLANVTYLWIAKNRHHLPGSTDACAVSAATAA